MLIKVVSGGHAGQGSVKMMINVIVTMMMMIVIVMMVMMMLVKNTMQKRNDLFFGDDILKMNHNFIRWLDPQCIAFNCSDSPALLLHQKGKISSYEIVSEVS